MINQEYKRFVDESENAYIWRITSMKEKIGTWNDVKNILNAELNLNYGESKYRKMFQSASKVVDDVIQKQIEDDEYRESIKDEIRQLQKERIKVHDATIEYRRLLRADSRIETLRDQVTKYVNELPQMKLTKNIKQSEGNEAVLAIGDWHIGSVFENYVNSFDKSVALDRVQMLADKTIKYCEVNNVTELHIINLGDMIEGNIHVSGRIQSDLNVIEQIKYAAELISQLLFKLCLHLPNVSYRLVLDNHSRATQNYKEHIEAENFSNLISWYLKERMQNVSNLNYVEDNIDENIGLLKLKNGKNLFFVHGHLENVSQILQNLTLGLDIIADYVVMGHWHSSKVKEFMGKKVYLNGSLIGTNTYAYNKRLFGKPSQMLLVFDGNDELDLRLNLG